MGKQVIHAGHRPCRSCGQSASHAPAQRLAAPRPFGPAQEEAKVHPGVLRPPSGGAPLPGPVRAKMEAAFGHDFANVRVHHGGDAESIGAVAYARGTHLHFAPGRYQPHSAAGQRLLGHELAHVVQQRAGRVPRPGGPVPINADPALEREADALGARAVRGATTAGRGHDFGSVAASAAPGAAAGAIQRHPRDRYDASGGEKWREFIDAKDHEAAAKWADDQGTHPGEFYDYRGGQKALESWRGFQHADAFVQGRLGTRLTAAEYRHMNLMAMNDAGYQKDWREGEVTWGLKQPASPDEAQALAAKGLQLQNGNMQVAVPMPEGGIQHAVQGHLDRYYHARGQAQDTDQHVDAITTLYQNLEALHAFKDGTSRTNHLVLNKLLSEVGLHPAILDEPNSPVHTHDAFKAKIYAGVHAGHEIAARQDEQSRQQLSDSREAIRENVEIDAFQRKHKFGKPDDTLAVWHAAPEEGAAVPLFEPGAPALEDPVIGPQNAPQAVMGIPQAVVPDIHPAAMGLAIPGIAPLDVHPAAMGVAAAAVVPQDVHPAAMGPAIPGIVPQDVHPAAMGPAAAVLAPPDVHPAAMGPVIPGIAPLDVHPAAMGPAAAAVAPQNIGEKRAAMEKKLLAHLMGRRK